MANRFAKGQVVYRASTRFATLGNDVSFVNGRRVVIEGVTDRNNRDITIGVVIERQVESCGQRQMTFYDRGDNDFIFGRQVYAPYETYFATAEEARAYLVGRCDLIAREIYSDANRQVFDDFRSNAMRFDDGRK